MKDSKIIDVLWLTHSTSKNDHKKRYSQFPLSPESVETTVVCSKCQVRLCFVTGSKPENRQLIYHFQKRVEFLSLLPAFIANQCCRAIIVHYTRYFAFIMYIHQLIFIKRFDLRLFLIKVTIHIYDFYSYWFW